MPLDRQAVFHLGILLLVVPGQYLLSKYSYSTESQRSYDLHRLWHKAVKFRDQVFSWRNWRQWCMNVLAQVKSDAPVEDDLPPDGESPAVEVLKYRDPNGYFATSPEVRSPKPPEVKYRVGQVIRHRRWGYRGVIVGWDLVAKAPEHWLKEFHPKDKKHWRDQPNYSMLVDVRDRPSPQITYVPQENFDIIIDTQIMHPELDSYFEAYDGAQYISRPWLKTIYPHG